MFKTTVEPIALKFIFEENTNLRETFPQANLHHAMGQVMSVGMWNDLWDDREYRKFIGRYYDELVRAYNDATVDFVDTCKECIQDWIVINSKNENPGVSDN